MMSLAINTSNPLIPSRSRISQNGSVSLVSSIMAIQLYIHSHRTWVVRQYAGMQVVFSHDPLPQQQASNQ